MDLADQRTAHRNPLAESVGREPTIGLLLGIFAVHTFVWVALNLLVAGGDRVGFDRLGAAGTPWVRQFVIPLGVVLVGQVAAIRTLGWWRPVMVEPQRSARRWLWVFPVLAGLQVTARFLSDGLLDAGAAHIAGMTATVALVGITEEFTFRGLLHVGARRVLPTEWRALLFSSCLFGLFHLPNALLGADLAPTIGQVVMTALIGSAIYCLRRVTGSLIVCMVFHAAFDWLVLQGAA